MHPSLCSFSAPPQRLESFNEIPDYNNYLTFVLTQLPSEDDTVRSMAGLLLKNNIRLRFEAFPAEVVAYVKAHIFSAIGDQVPMIRNTVSTVIDTLIVELGPAKWPEALQQLMALVDSPERTAQEVGHSVCVLGWMEERESEMGEGGRLRRRNGREEDEVRGRQIWRSPAGARLDGCR